MALGEAARILANTLTHGDIRGADRAYLAQLVSSRTGLSQNDADQRVSTVLEQARKAADTVAKRRRACSVDLPGATDRSV